MALLSCVMGSHTVLTAAVMSKKMATGDFFPLQVNYEEKMYAAGKFPGGFMKREGRPFYWCDLDSAFDWPSIRPMFAEGFRNEVQVINTVLSYDENASAPMAAMFGSSLALSISDIPVWRTNRWGYKWVMSMGNHHQPNAKEQTERSLLELTVAGTKHAINMVESGAKNCQKKSCWKLFSKGTKPWRIGCASKKKSLRQLGRKSRSWITSCRCWLTGWNHRSLQQWPSKAVKLKKIGAWSCDSSSQDQVHSCLRRENNSRPRRVWSHHAGCGWNLGTNGTRRGAPFNHRRQGSSGWSVIWVDENPSFWMHKSTSSSQRFWSLYAWTNASPFCLDP